MNLGGSGFRAVGAALLCALLAGCGDYSGRSDAPSSEPGGGGGGTAARSMEEHFSGKVQPQLDFCRTCHIPGGVADVENGKDFMLSTARSQDLANLRASWERLGKNNPTSRILLMSSGQEVPHSGGAPWPTGSAPYKNMEILLKCFENPSGCAALLGGGVDGGTLLPLLGSKHGGHAWFDFCEGKDDAATLPVDPRSLVKTGANAGKAVYFNVDWKDCHADPELVGERAQPKTCGELRESYARGEKLMRGNGGIGSGTFFAGDSSDGGALGLPSTAITRLWRFWGLSERPDNFDELLSQRYGQPMGTARNPYPLDGEDPQATDGGSGQLPVFMTQLRGENGEWTGKIGFTCHACHTGAAGLPEEGEGLGLQYGSGNSLQDIALMSREVGESGFSPGLIFSLFGTSRGTNK